MNTLTRAKELRLTDYKEGDRIFVYNRSGKPDRSGKNTRDSGDIIFPFMNSENQNDSITIPNTFIPIELTVSATVEALKRSIRLRSLLDQKILTLCTEAEYEKVMSSQRFATEKERLEEVRSGNTEKVLSGNQMRKLMDPSYQDDADRVAAPAPIATDSLGLVNATLDAVAQGSMQPEQAAVALIGLVKLLTDEQIVEVGSRQLDDVIYRVFENENELRNSGGSKND